MNIRFDPAPGLYISSVFAEAIAIANRENQPVEFTFNDVLVIARPGDSADVLRSKWDVDREARYQEYINSPEYKERQKRDAEAYRQRCEMVMIEKAQTEKEMRNAPDPWPYTEKQLLEYIHSLVERGHDYGTCCHAMSLAATAAFHYVSHKLGVTGFQASCADLDFIGRTRAMKGPFILLKAEDMVYPQYDLQAELARAMEGWMPWVREQAAIKLQESDGACDAVKAHWEKLAGQQ